MMRNICIWLLFLFLFQSLGADDNDLSNYNSDFRAFSKPPDSRVLLAISTKDYPVTPGDVYQLIYMDSQGLRSFEIIVSGDYSVNLTLFGKLDAENLTYGQLQTKIERLIQHAYPGSGPQLILQSTGIFHVFIKGEVIKSESINCWGLSKVSDVLQGKTTIYSSLRNVTVLSSDGEKREYDLFSAIRFGKREQNPYAKPGDTIIVKKAERRVIIQGEVCRPGTYQLSGGEELEELISYYADGLTKLSDAANIRITRYDAGGGKEGEVFYLDGSTPGNRVFFLKDLDEVFIPTKKELLPVVYFEGALVLTPEQKENKTSMVLSSGKYTYRFVQGELLSTAVRNILNYLAFSASLKDAYIIREGEKEIIPVNCELLLHAYSPEYDIYLIPFDRIVIPFKQYFVTVSGAVLLPGRYPYVPNRNYFYYVNCAGGSDPEKNINNAVRVSDIDDVKQPPEREIQPEDKIFVEYNNPLYHINQWAVFISTAISVTALVFSIIQLSR
jgi:polysaccharide export outer membrane protein